MTDSDGTPTVLLVDDDDVFRVRLARSLEARGYLVSQAKSAAEALARTPGDSPERAVVDLRLAEANEGLEVVRGLVGLDATTRVVVLTGYGSIATALEAVKLGAADYLTKPVALDALVRALEGTDPAPSTPAEATVPTLARVEWEHIQRVLADHGGNISAAARALGLHRRSLQRKLAKFPVPR